MFFRDLRGQYAITPQVLAKRTPEYRGRAESYARNHKIPVLKALLAFFFLLVSFLVGSGFFNLAELAQILLAGVAMFLGFVRIVHDAFPRQ